MTVVRQLVYEETRPVPWLSCHDLLLNQWFLKFFLSVQKKLTEEEKLETLLVHLTTLLVDQATTKTHGVIGIHILSANIIYRILRKINRFAKKYKIHFFIVHRLFIVRTRC